MEQITNIKEIQQISLEILKYIDKICTENNIQYFLTGGTLLGAIRHKGFIPWDDDVDLLMTRENYEKFLSLMDKQNHEKYKCLHYGKNFPNYYYRFAKVVDLDTQLSEGDFIRNKDLGVFVDIFPADLVDDTKASKLVKQTDRYNIKILRAASTKINNKNEKSIIKKILKPFLYSYAKLFGWKHWFNKHENFIKKHSKPSYKHRIVYSGGSGPKGMFPIEYLDDITFVEFEGYKFPAFRDYNMYLKNLYGDYMQLPPENQRTSNHTLNIYKKNKDF